MTTKHTPGPWRCAGHRQIATSHGAFLTICEVWSGGVGIEEADANENLIAAAPDLLGAADQALQALEVVRGGLPAGLSGVLVREAIDAARAAIAKARGDQQ